MTEPNFTRWKTDNRWSPGASGTVVPDDAPAAYSARWIDMGDHAPADVVPDRQGFAYNEPAERDRLIALMSQGTGDAIRTPYKANFLDRDTTTVVMNHPEWKMYVRRAGGYIYVDAWLVPTVDPQPAAEDDDLGVTVEIHRSELDGAIVVQIDTTFEPDGSADDPRRLRVFVNDWQAS